MVARLFFPVGHLLNETCPDIRDLSRRNARHVHRQACLSHGEWCRVIATVSLLAGRVSKIYGSAPCKAAATTPPIHHCPFADSAVVFVYLNCRFSPKEINTSEFKALRRQSAKRWTARRETARAGDISLRRCTR